MIGSAVTLARYISTIYGSSTARVALFGSSTRVEVNKIKGKPGDVKIIPIEVTNVKDGKFVKFLKILQYILIEGMEKIYL